MTTLLEPNRDASTGYSPLIPVFGWPGTLYKSSTASIRPTTSKAPSTLSNASPTSTKPARFPSTTTPWTPSSNWSDEILNWHHSRRSNGPLEGTNNLIQTLRRTAHGFTNPQNYAARGLLLT